MNCPSCGHPVSQHTDFYCLHVGCKCNISNVAAEARYWAVRYKIIADERKETIGKLIKEHIDMRNEIEHWKNLALQK